jgi:hypothetical protein
MHAGNLYDHWRGNRFAEIQDLRAWSGASASGTKGLRAHATTTPWCCQQANVLIESDRWPDRPAKLGKTKQRQSAATSTWFQRAQLSARAFTQLSAFGNPQG